MALTLDISPDMETLLRLKAAKHSQDITAYLLGLVAGDLSADLSEYNGLEDYASAGAGVQAGIEDMEAGRTYSLEETFAILTAHRGQRRELKAVVSS